MSNFFRQTRHPITGGIECAEWLDDHFGRRRYGVRFSDGAVFRESRTLCPGCGSSLLEVSVSECCSNPKCHYKRMVG